MSALRLLLASWCGALLLAATLGVSAQVLPPANLPESSGLPAIPRDTRLPGPDPRQCGTSKWSALCPAGRWMQFSRSEIEVKAPDFTARYSLEQPRSGEVHGTFREAAGTSIRGGELLLIGSEGFAYRSREALPPKNEVIDYMLSSPIMFSKLAAVLLDLGFLGAPGEVGLPQAISAGNRTQFIRAEAPAMATLYGPPWNMTGTVRRAADGTVAFAMRLQFHPVDDRGKVLANKTDTIRLEGTLSFAPARESWSDTFDLVGWKLVNRGELLRSVATLGEAREQMGR